MRSFLRQFMLYSRQERRAVVTLVILIVLVLISPRVYHFYFQKDQTNYQDSASDKSLIALQNLSDEDSTIQNKDSVKRSGLGTELFNFDPNTISISDWQRLGLTEKQADVIEKYRLKGGKFRSPDDLRKIFVISDEMKDRLVPYVKINNNGLSNKKNAKSFYSIEINTADSAAFEALYGIGPSLSGRIVRFRRLLGGFDRVEQVGETYGVSDSTFQQIKPHLRVDPALVTKIDINTAEYETLRKHPYIHAKIAKAIIKYREMNGKFENLEQVRGLKPITDELFVKISPYLKL